MSLPESAAIGGIYTLRVLTPRGDLRSEVTQHNRVVDDGLNLLLGCGLQGLSALSPWALGLKARGAIQNTDTMASRAWSEFIDYSGARKVWTPTRTGVGFLQGPVVSFAIATPGIILGAFLCSSTVKGGSGGRLYSVADWGDYQSVWTGDTVQLSFETRVVRYDPNRHGFPLV